MHAPVAAQGKAHPFPLMHAPVAAQGKAHPLPLLPDWTQLGGSPIKVGAALLAIAPVLLNADICHQSVFPRE